MKRVINFFYVVVFITTITTFISAQKIQFKTSDYKAIPAIGNVVPVPIPPDNRNIVGIEAVTQSTSNSFSSLNIELFNKFYLGSAVTPDNKTVFAVNQNGTISVIDAENNSLVKNIDISNVQLGITSGAVVVGNYLYVVGESKIVIMNINTDQIEAIISTTPPGGLCFGKAIASPAKDRVYTVYGTHDRIHVINTSTNSLITTAIIGNENTGIGVSPSGDKIYVSDRIHGNLTIIDSNSFSIINIKSFLGSLGFIPYTTAVSVGLDGRVYVGYVNSSYEFSIAILDANGNLIDTIVTTFSTGLEISKNGQLLITGNGNIIDINTKTVIADVATGIGEYQVNMSPDGLKAYVTNYNSTFITVIYLEPSMEDWNINWLPPSPPLAKMHQNYQIGLASTNPGSQAYTFNYGLSESVHYLNPAGLTFTPGWDLDEVAIYSLDGGFYAPDLQRESIINPGVTQSHAFLVRHGWNWIEPFSLKNYFYMAINFLPNYGAALKALSIAGNFYGAIDLLSDVIVSAPQAKYTYSGIDDSETSPFEITVVVPEAKLNALLGSIFLSAPASAYSSGGMVSGAVIGWTGWGLIPAGALLLGEAYMLASCENLHQQAVDPSDDYEFPVIPDEVIEPALEDIPLSPEKTSAELSIELYSITKAAAESYARYLGAISASSSEFAASQLAATNLYLDQANKLINELTLLSNDIVSNIQPPSPGDIADIRGFLANDGLPSIEVDALIRLGYTAEDISDMTDVITLADDSYFTSYANLPEALEDASYGISSIVSNLPDYPTGFQSMIVNDFISPAMENFELDFENGIFRFDMALINISATEISFPIRANISSLYPGPPAVTIINSDGGGNEVGAFWDYSDDVGDGKLSPGEQSAFVTWEFYDPSFIDYYFTMDVYGVIPTTLPKVSATERKGQFIIKTDIKNKRILINHDDQDFVSEQHLPTAWSLNQNYPNPFNSETIIKYQLPEEAMVHLCIYNLLGQEIRTLVQQQKQAGYYTAIWDSKDASGKDVVSGVYIYRIKVGEFVAEKKLVVIR